MGSPVDGRNRHKAEMKKKNAIMMPPYGRRIP